MCCASSSAAAAMIYLRCFTDDEVVVKKKEQLQRRKKIKLITEVQPLEAVLVKLDPVCVPHQCVERSAVLTC
jgi:hypothetical protein